jgi:hypothetical protein
LAMTASFFIILIGIVEKWSPIGSTRHCGHQYAYCANPGWLRWWRNEWNDDWQGKPEYWEKTCPSAASSTTDATCCSNANPGRCGGKPATNRLSYGGLWPLPYMKLFIYLSTVGRCLVWDTGIVIK